MPTLLSEAASSSAWSVSAPTAAKAMTAAYVRLNGKQPFLQLTPQKDLGSITVVWEPNVFGGSGDEVRQGIHFSIPDEIRQDLELIEERVREALKPSIPHIDSIWIGCTKPPSKHASLLKAKIVVSGEKACACFNAAGEPLPMPKEWPRLPAVPIIAVKSVYIQKAMAGLVLEVTSLMVGEPTTQGLESGGFL